MKMRRVILLVLVMMIVLIGIGIGYHRTVYPYGRSHCCILIMMFALDGYAGENGGKFPAGGESPEADLTQLYRSGYVDAGTLRGMTVPEETVQKILKRGDLLGPDTCGWHYVSGLTQADNPRLALLWCKSALNHNGRVSKDGGREVVFVGMDRQWISGKEWPAFLERQKELMKQRSQREINGEPLVMARIELPDGSLVDHVDYSYTLTNESIYSSSSSKGSSSGLGISSSELSWKHAPIQNGKVTRILSFLDLVSDPVTVTFKDGEPNINHVVFKMRRVGN